MPFEYDPNELAEYKAIKTMMKTLPIDDFKIYFNSIQNREYHITRLLMKTIENYHEEHMRIVAQYLASLEIENRQTILDDILVLFISYTDSYDPTSVKIIIDLGANPHMNDNWPLREAIKHSMADIVKVLVSYGCTTTLSPTDPAIYNAMEDGDLDYIKYLVSIGGNLRVKNDKVIQEACMYNLEILLYLLDQKVPISSIKNDTILQVFKREQYNVIKLLMSYGLDIKNNFDYIAVQITKK